MVELTEKYKIRTDQDLCFCKLKTTKEKQEKKSSKRKKRKPPKPFYYPSVEEGRLKTFQIKYNKELSSISKLILNSFQNKYLYYAIDDILDSFRTNPTERENLLAILYSPVLSLQNNLSINFFDIWIHEIHIQEIPKVNRFLQKDFANVKQQNYITIKLFYQTRLPKKKRDSLW